MTSRLKKQIVEGLLSQLKRKDPRLKQRLLNVVWPFSQKKREAVLVIGNSAHDVQMIQVADLSIYFNSEDSEETFEDARTYGNFNASSFQDLRRLVLVYGIQNSYSVSKVRKIKPLKRCTELKYFLFRFHFLFCTAIFSEYRFNS